ncbi:MAG: hypothetical protein WCA84_00765 [Ignavibacteriaceae bacterium]
MTWCLELQSSEMLVASGMLVENLSSINQFEPQSGEMVSCSCRAAAY